MRRAYAVRLSCRAQNAAQQDTYGCLSEVYLLARAGVPTLASADARDVPFLGRGKLGVFIAPIFILNS